LTAARTSEQEAAEALVLNGFADRAAARAAELPANELDDLRTRIAVFENERQRIAAILSDPDLADVSPDPAPIVAREAELNLAREIARAAVTADSDAAHLSKELDALLRGIDAQLVESVDGAEALALIRELASTVEGRDPNTRRMRLEVFVLAARLESIALAANQRLGAMVGGRYTLEHDDSLQARGKQSGLGLRVLDQYTGRPRSTESLSGGETFLASLSLALGLADVVTAEAGGITLDTIFIDEGFGSLDPDALGQAMVILDGLREGGRTVALISHVAEMKEQIPARIEVVVDASGASRIVYGDTGGSNDAPGKDMHL
jgi:exonuclease SbcC